MRLQNSLTVQIITDSMAIAYSDQKAVSGIMKPLLFVECPNQRLTAFLPKATRSHGKKTQNDDGRHKMNDCFLKGALTQKRWNCCLPWTGLPAVGAAPYRASEADGPCALGVPPEGRDCSWRRPCRAAVSVGALPLAW